MYSRKLLALTLYNPSVPSWLQLSHGQDFISDSNWPVSPGARLKDPFPGEKARIKAL